MLLRMARPPRLDIAGISQHVVQRGNNRLPCFLDDEDRQRYLQCLRQALLRLSGERAAVRDSSVLSGLGCSAFGRGSAGDVVLE
jgi:hypothetical protein